VTTPRALIALGLAVSFLAIATTSASAATTRAEYVGQADPICQSAKAPFLKAFGAYFRTARRKGAFKMGVNERKLAKQLARPAAKLYRRLAFIYNDVTNRLSSVSPAPGDDQIVSAWLQARREVPAPIRGSARAIGHWKLKRANNFFKLTDIAVRRASETVRDFGFRYCAPPGSDLIDF
jgi:hypothetical protein